jgi:adenine/guanine phosphoribosyltransferase-like PRPP-binding protein
MENALEYNEKAELQKANALQIYENKWVALVDDKVVASGETMQETAENAEKAGYKDITFYLVPSSSVSYALHFLR